MSSISYVPILPTKAGELAALGELPAEIKATFTPLLVIHPITYDFEADRPSKTADQHVVGLGRKIAKAWGTERAFLDPILISDEPTAEGAPDPVLTVLDDAAAQGLQLVPVVTLGQQPEYTALVAAVHRDTGVGVCVRLAPGQWPYMPPRAQALDDLLDALGVTAADADLVLDLGVEVHSDLASELATMALQSLPHIDAWRSLTLAGGSFPENLSKVDKDRLVRIPRLEWRIYQQVAMEAAVSGLRVPTFGDYAIAHPDASAGDIDPRMISISANQRYTIQDEWLVAKGALYKGTGGRSQGGAACLPVARLIAGAPEFCGPDFSAGDAWIYQTAHGQTNGGSPTTWRRVGTSHHLTFVSRSFATRSAS